jgi:hypothetical protein
MQDFSQCNSFSTGRPPIQAWCAVAPKNALKNVSAKEFFDVRQTLDEGAALSRSLS